VGADGRLRKLHTRACRWGMIEEATVEVVEIRLEPGDKVVIYSDGLTETENGEGEFFGTEGLRACARDHFRDSAAGLHRAAGGAGALQRWRSPARRRHHSWCWSTRPWSLSHDGLAVAHALMRAASPLLATPSQPRHLIYTPPPGLVEKSLDTARMSACATPGE